MLLPMSSLRGYAIEAEDGRIGTVSDVLFDDRSWKLRWLVVDTAAWLTGRKVLIHPAAIRSVAVPHDSVALRLTRAQVRGSPDIMEDEPVSRQMQDDLYGYYGWDPLWSGGVALGPAMGMGAGWPLGLIPPDAAAAMKREGARPDRGDPHLRSARTLTGYHIQAADGAIGHVEDFLVENQGWGIRYLVVDTRNWWPGRHVLLSPHAVRGISWPAHEVVLDVSRERVKGSPAWDPSRPVGREYEERLHGHYGWPGYGW